MTLDDFLIRPGRRVRLARLPTDRTGGLDKRTGQTLLAKNIGELADQQERLYVQNRWSVLVILQALDGAGKDSTIKHVMSGVNPQGVSVTSFKAPSALELDHDYLWRSVVALPARGMIGIHNRSYYEEVLVVRVHKEILSHQQLPDRLKDDGIWERRFRQINDFERYLVENGTAVIKIFLHVSRDEQRRRFLDRIEDPTKQWKFALRDVEERESWKDYERVYEATLQQTSTAEAPWYVVPADRKWFMHLAVGQIIVERLRALKLALPEPDPQRARELEEGRRLLEAEDD